LEGVDVWSRERIEACRCGELPLSSWISWFGGRLTARMDGGMEVGLSRRKSKEFRELMSV